MTVQEKMHNVSLYLPSDPAVVEEQTRCLERLYDYNATRPGEGKKRQALLREMFAELGENCYVEPPLHANFGGKFVHFGNNVYANFNLTLVDDTHIYVGDCTMFGPNVTLATAGHPILPELRAQGYQYNAPIHIGKNCWIGAAARGHTRGQCGGRCRQCGHQRPARQCGGGGQPLPGAAPHHRQRPGILLQTASHRPGTAAITKKRPAFARKQVFFTGKFSGS